MRILFSAALFDTIQECRDNNEGIFCFVDDEAHPFKDQWRDCIFGELTEKEQEWSYYITKAWVNFATHRYVRLSATQLLKHARSKDVDFQHSDSGRHRRRTAQVGRVQPHHAHLLGLPPERPSHRGELHRDTALVEVPLLIWGKLHSGRVSGRRRCRSVCRADILTLLSTYSRAVILVELK